MTAKKKPYWARKPQGKTREDLKQMVAEAIQEHVDMGRLQEIIENQEEQREELRMKLQDAIGDDTE